MAQHPDLTRADKPPPAPQPPGNAPWRVHALYLLVRDILGHADKVRHLALLIVLIEAPFFVRGVSIVTSNPRAWVLAAGSGLGAMAIGRIRLRTGQTPASRETGACTPNGPSRGDPRHRPGTAPESADDSGDVGAGARPSEQPQGASERAKKRKRHKHGPKKNKHTHKNGKNGGKR
jgi:hypothetical protein